LWRGGYAFLIFNFSCDIFAAVLCISIMPKTPVPCVIGLHGVFSPSEEQFWMMADFLAKRGIAGIAPSLPQHHRRAKGTQLISGQRFVVGPPETIRDNLRQSVVDQRRAVDWLTMRPEVDSEAISIAGISLGGIVGSLTYKVEPRIRSGIFVVAGSGVDGIVENSDLSVIAAFRQAARIKILDPQKFCRCPPDCRSH